MVESKKSVLFEKPLLKSKSKPSKLGMNNQRSVILFHSAIKSDKTKIAYQCKLGQFMKHFIIKDFDSLLKISPKKTQEMIEDWILYERSRDLSSGTIKISISALSLFYSMNDIMINWKKIQRMIPEQRKAGNDKPYTTEHLQQMIHAFSNDIKCQALVHFMASSGVRVGAIAELRLKDLDDMPNDCKSVRVYADTRYEYYTFIHQEAVTSLEKYLKTRTDLTPDSPLFVNNNNEPLEQQTITQRFSHKRFEFRNDIIKSHDRKKRHDIAIIHGIRKRWNTIMKNNQAINPLMTEKMFGHNSSTIPLDTVYHKPTLDILFKEYQKAIPDLMIDQTLILKSQIEAKNNELLELRKKDQQIQELQDTMQNMKNNLIELEKRMNPNVAVKHK